MNGISTPKVKFGYFSHFPPAQKQSNTFLTACKHNMTNGANVVSNYLNMAGFGLVHSNTNECLCVGNMKRLHHAASFALQRFGCGEGRTAKPCNPQQICLQKLDQTAERRQLGSRFVFYGGKRKWLCHVKNVLTLINPHFQNVNRLLQNYFYCA